MKTRIKEWLSRNIDKPSTKLDNVFVIADIEPRTTYKECLPIISELPLTKQMKVLKEIKAKPAKVSTIRILHL